MIASSGSDWPDYNGTTWQLTGTHYSHVSGGAPWMIGHYLYFLGAGWSVGTDVTSANALAYVLATSYTPAGSIGRLQ
jgi:hypothetical protein